MPRLEIDYDQAASLTTVAPGQRSLTPEQLEWATAFYGNVKARMLNLYDAARLGTWRLFDRKDLIDYWREQEDWFGGQLRFIRGLEDRLKKEAIDVPPALSETIEALIDIVDLCHGHYKVYA
jgi:hypothetical protein